MTSDTYKKEELAISKALEAYELDQTQEISVLSRKYGAPYDRLRRRLQRIAYSQRLRSALEAWIKCLRCGARWHR
jgi:hypothetical protein